MATQIAKTTQSLTTAAEMRDMTKMLMQPNANWEEYLTPAPLSIAIMGELVFISSCDDFSISKNTQSKEFKYIKYPDSFRACLMQVCNSGWHAFNEAHKNMDQIRIYTATVPNYMKAVVDILFHGNDEVIETILPNQLKNIRTIADECLTLAEGVEKKYTDVIELIGELLEACTDAKHFYGEELEKVKIKLKETEIREKSAKEMNEWSKKAMENMSKQLDEAQDAYKKSVDSFPSGWNIIAMNLVEEVAQIPARLMNALTVVNLMKIDPCKADDGSFSYLNKGDENVDKVTQIKACSKSGQILTLVASLKQFVSEDGIDWNNLYDQKTASTNTTWTDSQLKRISEELESMKEGELGMKALSLCERGINICDKLAEYTPDKNWDEKTTTKLIKDIKKLNDDAFAFDSKSKGILGSPALSPKSPMMFKAENNSSGTQSATQTATETACFLIEQSQEQLKQSRESYEKCVQNMKNSEKELNEILIEMQNCKIKEIDFNTTIKMLVKGLDAMGRVKVQWNKMVRFFQMVSNIVKTSLSMNLNNFVKTSEDTKKLSYDGKLFAKDLLYNQAFQASNIASLVHMISETYTEVSNKYLMDRVSSLGKLMAMDTEKPEFLHERLKLQESCQAAQDGIQQLVQKNKKEFERKCDVRMAKIEGELKAILPIAPAEETERIKEIVQAGFSENYY